MFTFAATMSLMLLTALAGGVATWAVTSGLWARRYDELNVKWSEYADEVEARWPGKDLEQVVVTLYDVDTDAFVEAKRFGPDLYTALSEASLLGMSYNVSIKAQLTTGEYTNLYLVNVGS
jgi:hypothetical protein